MFDLFKTLNCEFNNFSHSPFRRRKNNNIFIDTGIEYEGQIMHSIEDVKKAINFNLSILKNKYADDA